MGCGEGALEDEGKGPIAIFNCRVPSVAEPDGPSCPGPLMKDVRKPCKFFSLP